MKNTQWLEGIGKEAASLIEAYVDDGGCEVPQSAARWISSWEMSGLAKHLAAAEIREKEVRLCVTLLFALANHPGDYAFIREFSTHHEAEVLAIAAEMDHPPCPEVLAKAILGGYFGNAKIADDATAAQPFQSAFWNHAWKHLDWSAPLLIRSGWIRALARWHPRSLVEVLSKHPESVGKIMHSPLGCEVFDETDLADDLFIGWASQHLTETPANPTGWSSGPSDRCKAFFNVRHLSDRREGRYFDLVMRLSAMPEFSSSEHAVDMLLRHGPEKALETVAAGIGHHTSWDFSDVHRKLVELAIGELDGAGAALLNKILIQFKFQYGWARKVNAMLLGDPEHPHAEVIRRIYLDHVAGLSGKKISDFWAGIAKYDKGLFLPEWRVFAEGKSKPLREAAATWLLAHRAEDAVEKIDRLIDSNATEDRLAAVSLLASSAGDPDIARLKSMHGSEPTKQVRLAIAAALAKHGVQVTPEPEKEVERVADIAAFESSLRKRAKSIRLPKATWLDARALPPLKTTDGETLSELATVYILQCQARAKAGVIEPEVAVLLPHLSRSDNATFAHALLDQWFASDMKAPTRWALDVAGITGDDTIIERLTQPIPDWCKANHGSRAEWAVHAIALLGSEKALGTLDGLIHRYRSQRKYVSAAASLAIFRTAEMLGIGTDELAERIVPDFGFDGIGERKLPIRNGHATAVLCHDFKIAWKDGFSDKLVANPPGKLTEESEADLKDTRKFLKEAVSRQTARLQDAMIGGRRWAIDVWTNRFGKHPVFRILAMRLVWGVYDADGNLLRTFRLYPNGLTADATGALEEFPESNASIGIPHRMELNDKTVKDWSAHLRRFKVKPLFSQLDRPVHRLDPEHGNRREIRLTKNVKTTAGTLRKELLGRGWSMAAAGDGGRLCGMWRRFPGTTIEVYLPANELHAASMKDDPVTLEAAYFAGGNPSKTNVADFPAESCAVSFGEIPPVIFSETIADLEVLVNGKT
jgi:hypothetical protein